MGRIFRRLGKKGVFNFMSDETYLKILYRLFMQNELNLSAPRTLNEKIQWLKLYDRQEKYISMVDKASAKEYAAKIIGKEHIIPTLGIWNQVEDLDIASLPQRFVLKCTHDSGSVIICKDKKNFDFLAAKKKLRRSLAQDYSITGREWVYQKIKPCIIAEAYLEDGENHTPDDYKFYCFGDYVDCVLVCTNRSSGRPLFYFFDRNWKLKRYNQGGREAPKGFTLPKPAHIEEMFDMAKKLSVSVGAPFLRVDLYNVEGKIYFGELTFYPDCGLDRHRLPDTDLYFGSLVRLPILQGTIA